MKKQLDKKEKEYLKEYTYEIINQRIINDQTNKIQKMKIINKKYIDGKLNEINETGNYKILVTYEITYIVTEIKEMELPINLEYNPIKK